MDLILWRHAQAQDPQPGEDDLSRVLTGKGRKQASAMAQWLRPHLPSATRILVSPALRTRQTADALELPYQIVETIAPDAHPTALLSAADWPDSPLPVMLVGHQPTLGYLASRLLCGIEQPWAIKKGAVWWIKTDSNCCPRLVFSLCTEQL